jgi:hypothetical protein
LNYYFPHSARPYNPEAVEVVEEVKTEPKKITKEDNERYDRNLKAFMEQKKEELKGKVFTSGGLKDKAEIEKEKTEAKEDKTEKMKKELKGVTEKHQKAVETQKKEAEAIEAKKTADKAAKEAEKAKREAEKLANIVYVDASNTDDRKKLADLMDAGKIIMDDKDRPFILAVQRDPIYNDYNPPVHKVYCDEIVHVTVRKYYMDMVLMPPGSRTLIRELIWVYHKGYETFSTITKEQMDYLLDNNFITTKQVFYAYNDKDTGLAIFNNNPNEPTVKQVEDEIAHWNKIHPKDKKINSYLSSSEKSEDVEEQNETIMYDTDIEDTNTNEELTEDVTA